MDSLRYIEVSNLNRSDTVMRETHMSIFIEKSKTDAYKQRHWLHLVSTFSVETNKDVF